MNLLYNPQIYTTIMLGIARVFKSKHSLSLWENCHCYLFKKETPSFTIEDWKRLLGVSEKYSEFKVFSQKVLKKAIDEVNNISDIIIEPVYKRDHKRNVTHISFKVDRNPANNQKWIQEYPPSIQGSLFDIQQNMASKFWIKKIQTPEKNILLFYCPPQNPFH
jgi:plasmid replication initiation protein